MLNILAHTFKTATRRNTVKARGIVHIKQRTKKRWLPKGHWWLASYKDIDLDKL